MSGEPVLRAAARVLLLDPAGRVLLLHYRMPETGFAWWGTPGGGMHAGETPEQAARREVLEETGLSEFALGPCVWTRTTEFAWEGRRYRQSERIYVARVDAFEPTGDNRDLEEHGVIDDHRWWTADEIASSQERFAPRRLGSLLRALLGGGYPADPIDVGR